MYSISFATKLCWIFKKSLLFPHYNIISPGPQVLAFIVFVCAAVVSSHTNFPDVFNVTDVNAARDLTHGGAGYIIFILFVAMIWEGVIIALHFLNLPIVNKYIGLLLIAVSSFLVCQLYNNIIVTDLVLRPFQ